MGVETNIPTPTSTPSIVDTTARRSHDAGSFFSPSGEARIGIAPHKGYREYFQGPIEPTSLPELFDDTLSSADFPTVTFAEGWAYAEHALRNQELPQETRMAYLGEAAIRWDSSCRMIRHVYDEYPRRFLLWPGTRWRYQLSRDTLPAMEAIINHEAGDRRPFDKDLLDLSRENTRETLRILMAKHRWTVEQQSALLDDPSENAREILRSQGRIGSIIGVALEAAGINIAQLAKPRYAITPASLRSEEAQAAGADLLLWDSMNPDLLRSGQIKRRVDNKARRKYRAVPLICAIHHMKFDDKEPLLSTLDAVVNDTDQKGLRLIGGRLIAIMHGDRSYGCSKHNPRIQRNYEARVHKKTVAA